MKLRDIEWLLMTDISSRGAEGGEGGPDRNRSTIPGSRVRPRNYSDSIELVSSLSLSLSLFVPFHVVLFLSIPLPLPAAPRFVGRPSPQSPLPSPAFPRLCRRSCSRGNCGMEKCLPYVLSPSIPFHFLHPPFPLCFSVVVV